MSGIIIIIGQNGTINELHNEMKDLHHQVTDNDWRLDEQEQYSKRNSLRFHNIPCPDQQKLRDMDTDKIVMDICNEAGGTYYTE